jgi:hypothetical protein
MARGRFSRNIVRWEAVYQEVVAQYTQAPGPNGIKTITAVEDTLVSSAGIAKTNLLLDGVVAGAAGLATFKYANGDQVTLIEVLVAPGPIYLEEIPPEADPVAQEVADALNLRDLAYAERDAANAQLVPLQAQVAALQAQVALLLARIAELEGAA